MRVDAFDFTLPEENIALRPARPRDAARLLTIGAGGRLNDHIIKDLPDLLNAGDMLVVNDTKVIPARLTGERRRAKASGAKIEVTLIERLESVIWRCFLQPAKRVKAGDMIYFSDPSGTEEVAAHITACNGGEAEIIFQLPPAEMESSLVRIGAMPLPPYIASKRRPDAEDFDDYQTLFACHDGAIAAPTAGLHFTPRLYETLQAKGVQFVRVTLHVGPGTFLPVRVDDTDDHIMHAEWGEVTPDVAAAINKTKAAGGKLICVGTTSLRLIESAAQKSGRVEAFSGTTDIFITPGYQFKATDRLLTNFHLPKSTLFMLVSAFSGLAEMKQAYQHAIDNGYRFYSYGDACLLDCVAQNEGKQI